MIYESVMQAHNSAEISPARIPVRLAYSTAYVGI